MAEIARVSVEDAHRDVATGRAILVCAYDDEQCRQVALEESIPLSALAARSAHAAQGPTDHLLLFLTGRGIGRRSGGSVPSPRVPERVRA
jgi:hypothetical protein